MRKIILTAALATGPAMAVAAEPVRTDVDGYRLEYTRSVQADGSTILDGLERKSGSRYRFIVKNGRVKGHVDGRYVAFQVPARALPGEASFIGSR